MQFIENWGSFSCLTYLPFSFAANMDIQNTVLQVRTVLKFVETIHL